MPVFATQLEGDRLLLLEAETSGAFNKSELEFRPHPMSAFDHSMIAIADVGRVLAERARDGLTGTGVESAEVTFGVKIDGMGMVMLAQESSAAQFTVKLTIRVT
jgi:Trypsin-co-occurring domain 1